MEFTEKGKEILSLAAQFATLDDAPQIYTGHLLKALLAAPESAAKAKLNSVGFGNIKAPKTPKTSKYSVISATEFSPKLRDSINALNANGTISKVGSLELLTALSTAKGTATAEMLKNSGLDIVSTQYVSTTNNTSRRPVTALKTLEKYAVNLCTIRNDACFGREKEIAAASEILLRRRKNNPCLIGEAGVGKTAIAEGIARAIANNTAPSALHGKRIYALDLAALVAGARYRGDFEERVEALFAEVKGDRSIVLFIDEIHTICGAGAAEGAVGLSDIMKPLLARGDISVIGATTRNEYEKYIEKDPALERRFTPVEITEPDTARTLEILHGAKGEYERYHNVSYTDGALSAAVELSDRYLPYRYQPDKALDLIDTAGAANSNTHIQITAEHISALIDNTGLPDTRKILYFGSADKAKEYAKLNCAAYPIIPINGAEYSDSTAVSKLIGAAPGYAGYDDNVSVCAKIRRVPRSVLIISDFQKFAPTVTDVFTGVFRDRKLTDSKGRATDFRSVLIILTTNAKTARHIGFGIDEGGGDVIVEDTLPKGFPDEWREFV
ncbi:MAG: AAA family ATPase [Oscillospiraceae bacterium]|jgi:ATP-dependent Clp protease ATP-binding subunit ClpA|nr:AAA family ATPase [Oscillospiraceae bacterium]